MPESGGIINTNIVRCIARWVLLHKNKFIPEEFVVLLADKWMGMFNSQLMTFTKREDITGINHKPEDIDNTKHNFSDMIKQMKVFKIPENRIFNRD